MVLDTQNFPLINKSFSENFIYELNWLFLTKVSPNFFVTLKYQKWHVHFCGLYFVFLKTIRPYSHDNNNDNKNIIRCIIISFQTGKNMRQWSRDVNICFYLKFVGGEWQDFPVLPFYQN